MPRGQYERNRSTALRPEEGAPQPQSADSDQVQSALSPRAEETRRERRRRDDGDLDRMARMKLAVPREIQEQARREGKVYRWFLDEPGRIAGAFEDDWDKVENVDAVSGFRDNDLKHVLMWKYKDWHESDERAEQSSLDEREAAIASGTSPENRRAGDGLVVPEGQRNRISRKRGL